MGIWPLKKKSFEPKDRLHFEDRWDMLRGVDKGRPMLVRRRAASGLIGHPEYPYQVGIAIPCNDPDANGFPGKDELPQLDEIDDKLVAALQRDNESVLVIVITTGNMREFVFYTSAPESVKVKFERLQAEITTHQLQMIIQADKDWRVYRAFEK
jgi:hypothetical protein